MATEEGPANRRRNGLLARALAALGLGDQAGRGQGRENNVYDVSVGLRPGDPRPGDADEIRKAASAASMAYRGSTGPSVTEFFARVSAAGGKDQQGKKLVAVADVLAKAEQAAVASMLQSERERIQLYDTLEAIHRHIPQVASGLEAYVENILSPDDITKTSLNVSYEGGGDEEHREAVMTRLKDLVAKYKLEEKIHQLISESLKVGDQFEAVLPLGRELGRLLALREGAAPVPEISGGVFLEGFDVANAAPGGPDREALDALMEAAGLQPVRLPSRGDGREKEEGMKKALLERRALEEGFLEEIAAIVNENVVLGDSSAITASAAERHTEYARASGNKESDRGKTPSWTSSAPGSVVRLLDPRRVVKLQVDETCYGYYYLESLAKEEWVARPRSNYTDMLSGVQNTLAGSSVSQDGKAKIVGDLLVRTIGKRIDDKFARSNPEFRSLIQSVLSQGEILSGKVRVIYLAPDEVVHFRPPYGGEEYGVSLYQKILFTAKLYMATLTSTLMNRLVRGPDKRVFYVEVGVDNDVESAIQSFIRDIKSKDIRLDDLGNMTTIFNSVGQFHDLYVPVVDGQKPIEIETISGTDVNLDNDFLEYLRKSMISGLGLPSSLLQSGEEVDYARTLTMQNARFARTITTYQKVYGEAASALLRLLYSNEYLSAEKSGALAGEKEGTDSQPRTDVSKIFVRFPPPYSLMTSTVLEQLNNARDVMAFVVDTIVGEDVDAPRKRQAKLAVAKEVARAVDWERFEKVVERAMQRQNIEDSIANPEPPAQQGGSSPSSMLMGDEENQEDQTQG